MTDAKPKPDDLDTPTRGPNPRADGKHKTKSYTPNRGGTKLVQPTKADVKEGKAADAAKPRGKSNAS